jgi:starch synthase
MRVLFVTSEAFPLMKTGGLGDVCGSLPPALAALGVDVRVLMPAYPEALAAAGKTRPVARLALPPDGAEATLLEGRLPGTKVRVWLLDHPPSFDRPGNPYTAPDGHGWADNAQRFARLSRAAVALALGQSKIPWRPNVVHGHDWQTGLVAALLEGERERPATVFTIHNLAYQGLFPYDAFVALRLPHRLWSFEALEFHGRLSFIKGGIAFADAVTTVSPNYAREIQTAEFGEGLDGLLRHRAAQGRGHFLPSTVSAALAHPVDRDSSLFAAGAAGRKLESTASSVVGILNGIDPALWNPARDPDIAARYSLRRLQDKLRNKLTLQHELRLPQDASVPLAGWVGRMVWQKGMDLLLAALPALAEQPMQLVLLGSGEARFEHAVREAAARHPGRIAALVGYDETLAHRIFAGADLFLMPSRFEPCGLSQLYALRYGTVPLVRGVGGLADTVSDASEESLRAGTATGIVFNEAQPEALTGACLRALELYRRPRLWRKLMLAGMRQDHSWRHSAQEYRGLYGSLIANASRG